MNFAGVELGGTKCVAILARGPDEVLEREVFPTTTPEETLSKIKGVLQAWKGRHGFGALGIASFGPIDLDPASQNFGRLGATPKPGWAEANVGPRLRTIFDVPTEIDTDVNGAALAEMRWGSGRGMDDFAYITVGTGIGVGLIVNGSPTRGFAHCELGHIPVARLPGDDWPGSCPFHGDCVEGLASGAALKARFGEALGDLRPEDAAWHIVASALAQLCHAIVCASAPRAIAIGGGVIERQPHLLEMVQDRLAESLGGYLTLPAAPYVQAPALGKDAGPLGAIALAMKAKPRLQ